WMWSCRTRSSARKRRSKVRGLEPRTQDSSPSFDPVDVIIGSLNHDGILCGKELLIRAELAEFNRADDHIIHAVIFQQLFRLRAPLINHSDILFTLVCLNAVRPQMTG